MTNLQALTQQILEFRDARDWKQFHKTKDMLLSLMLEAAELAELSQWKTEEQLQAEIPTLRDKFADELADVLYWVLLISNDLGIEIEKAFEQKMQKNAAKYPVSKFQGKARKYNAFE